MKRPTKDPYSILGVEPDASQENIRNAYLSRTRIIHPDKIDKKSHPKDWEQANVMLAELNDAYATLKDPTTRKEYDSLRSAGSSTASTTSSPPPSRETKETKTPFGFGELSSGYAKYSDLPTAVRGRLIERQNGRMDNFYRVKLDSLNWNFVFILVLPCWFWFIFNDAKDSEWHSSTIGWYWFFSLAVGYLLARNGIKIFSWFKSTLKPYFYVTPLYFIKTDHDIVSFWPIWLLKDFSVTHVHTNGSYTRSDVTLKFDSHFQVFSINSKPEVEKLFETIKTFDSRIRAAYQDGKFEYFKHHDDFFGVQRLTVPTSSFLSKPKIFGTYAVSMSICALVLLIAMKVNGDYEQSRWVYHPSNPDTSSEVNSLFNGSPNPKSGSIPEKPLPPNGKVRYFSYKERVAPLQIKADVGSNYLVKLVDLSTGTPALTIFIRDGQEVNIDVPLGTYEMRYASGTLWYGDEYLFGADTSYFKADKNLVFDLAGDQVRGHTVTLYKVRDGNLQTYSMKPTDF